MQSWTGRGSRSLFCALRLFPRPVERQRQFTTSLPLHRSKRENKHKEARSDNDASSAKRSAKSAMKSGHTGPNRNSIAGQRDFNRVVQAALQDAKVRLNSTGDLPDSWNKFERQISNACKVEDSKSDAKWGPLKQIKSSLQRAYLSGGVAGLRGELDYMRYADDLTAKYSTPNLEVHQKIADLRYPAEWYPKARSMQRTIHLHVGPTNSGKTYHALQRLKQSKSGFYAGPLRLLAQEVYHRFKAEGIPTSLVTGDDVKTPEDGQIPRITSNTVEMVSVGQEYDIGVIDEIQMISNAARGWAWTRAVLGSQAKELHLCGETRAVPLIRELCALTGDTLEIHRYERLNRLEVMDKSLRGNLKSLEKGDCVVAFSRVGIHALKADIEKVTGRRAAIVYGGLPAEIRTQQANLFNDPDNDYDFLVASDAIGMGLNLSCKRVIFETLVKRLPGGLQQLTVPEIKQIGGRAGRYRPAGAKESPNDKSNVGLVTSLEEIDLPSIQMAMNMEPPPLRAAGIFPPNVVFEQLSAYFPKEVPFEYLIKRLNEIAAINPLFFMCDNKGQLENAEIIDTTNGLRVADQLTFMAAPMDTRSQTAREVTAAFADCVAENNRGRLLDIPHLNLEILERPVSGNKDYLHELESLHKAIILYSWLSFRFGGVFTDRTLAAHVKELVEQRMVRALTEFSANKSLRKDASLKRQIALQKQLHRQKTIDSQGLMPQSAEGGEGDVQIRMNEDGSQRSADGEESAEEEMQDDLNEESFEETVDNEASSAELMLDHVTGESTQEPEKEAPDSEKPKPRSSA
ncbi:hypothetical protein N7481_012855 [Penicillium waksmanii]|uniref:uncharacterized protein n=1 Tax=Penicillium waksmanii TaxID=69791 RepID=UPI0025469D20|nr:uncharacterized protein N7481_012855 [Penicillium waksmanii]KAJ5966141.1 hypothetical protein N7481_012855 [Penicillium waksmanii]